MHAYNLLCRETLCGKQLNSMIKLAPSEHFRADTLFTQARVIVRRHKK